MPREASTRHRRHYLQNQAALAMPFRRYRYRISCHPTAKLEFSPDVYRKYPRRHSPHAILCARGAEIEAGVPCRHESGRADMPA